MKLDDRLFNWPTLKIYFWKNVVNCIGLARVNLSGVEYGFRNSSTVYSLEICAPSPSYYKYTFDVTELDRYLIVLNIVPLNGLRKNVDIYVRANGAGEITFVQKSYRSVRVQNLFLQIK